MDKIIELVEVVKEYKMGEVSVLAANNISFHIEEGEYAVILGPSGSGKSTVLNIMGGMDKPTSGKVIVNGSDISKYSDRDLTLYRRNMVGFVFQFYNLMPNLTAVENIEMAAQLSKNPLNIGEVIDAVGLKGKERNFPSQLSGGEQQRVSIARAVVKNPSLLLCDEPTGALDYNTGKMILKLLHDVNRKLKKTVVIITHNSPIAHTADKVIKVKSGHVESLVRNENPQPIERIEW